VEIIRLHYWLIYEMIYPDAGITWPLCVQNRAETPLRAVEIIQYDTKNAENTQTPGSATAIASWRRRAAGLHRGATCKATWAMAHDLGSTSDINRSTALQTLA
jgi:hypothetical protein